MIEYDVTDLQQGDCIDVNECERLLEISNQHKDYAMAVMTLAKQIEYNLWRTGRQFTVCTTGGSIRVLTNAEAIEYNEATFEAGKRKMRLANRRSIAIDTSGLTDALRVQHSDNLAKQGRILSAMRQRPVMILEPTEKNTPVRTPIPSA